MKSTSKLFRGLSLILCLVLVFSLAACGKDKDKDSDSSTSAADTELSIGNFKLTIDKSFEQTSGKYDGEDTKYFGKNGGRTSLVINDVFVNHASHDMAVGFICENMIDVYEVTTADIKQEKVDDDHYYLTWVGKYEGKNINGAAYLIFEQGSELAIYLVDEEASAEEIRAELQKVADTVAYTGEELIVKDNYTIMNNDFKIKINDGYETPQLQEAQSIDPSSDAVLVDADTIAIYFKNADTYDRGDSYFKIAPMKDQTKDIAELANEKAKPSDPDKSGLEKTLTETTMGEIWPDLTDDSLKEVKLYKLTIVIDDNPFTAETYYFNYNNKNYTAAVLYPYGDTEAHDKLLNQFYQVEFIKAE